MRRDSNSRRFFVLVDSLFIPLPFPMNASDNRVLDIPLVKICGTTSVEDAELSASAGADFLGVIVEHQKSPRHVDLEAARDIFAATELPVVAVTVNKSLEELLKIYDTLQPFALQLHGGESPELARQLAERNILVWAACSGEREISRHRALQMTEAGAQAVLLDARTTNGSETVYGGTGQRSDWELARELRESGLRVILSGGLSPDNVQEAIVIVRPWMVDVVSGVEAQKGVKDAVKVREFVQRSRSNSQATSSHK